MVDAAEAEFAERGFEGTTMDRIAAAAGVSKSHLYYHFDSKDDLLAGLFADRVERILADKEALIAGAAVVDDVLVETMLGEGIERLVEAHPAFLRIVLRECFRPEGRRDLVFGLLRRLTDDTAARFSGFGADVDPEVLASAMTWFALLPILAELLLGGDWARALGLDPDRQHTLFRQQLGGLYRVWLAGLAPAEEKEDRYER